MLTHRREPIEHVHRAVKSEHLNMARRAAIITQTDLDRSAKAAAKVGYEVVIGPDGTIRLVPPVRRSENSHLNDDGANPWDAALQC